MFGIAWLIVMYFSEPSLTDTARASHSLETCPILPAKVSVLIAWIIHITFIIPFHTKSTRFRVPFAFDTVFTSVSVRLYTI